ncbi:MAG: hypothetical protein ABID45_04445 [Patescibacteria group bacterium]
MKNFKLHKNSQKRIYESNKIYFITLITQDRYNFFNEKIFNQIFINEIDICKYFYNFKLYGYVILLDHIHLMLNPLNNNISDIIKFVKRHASRDINILIKENFEQNHEGEDRDLRLQKSNKNRFKNLNKIQKQKILWMEEKMKDYNFIFQNKYNHNIYPKKFKWQKSFRDHIIRNEVDFKKHIEYIEKNPYKHKIVKPNEDYRWTLMKKTKQFYS